MSARPHWPWFAATAGATLVVAMLLSLLHVDLIEDRFGYDVDTVTGYLAALGADGRGDLRVLHAVDMLFAATYCLAMMATLRPVSPWRWLWLAVPIVPAAADVVENVLLEVLSARYPAVSPGLVRVASAATVLKWSGTVLWLACGVVLWIRWLVQRIGAAGSLTR